MASRKARIIAGVTGAVVIAGVVAASVIRDRRSKVTVQTQKAGRQDLVSMVSASGEVKPKKFVNISANVSGRITNLYVQEGDAVRKGQVLARIDSTRYEAGERQSEAALQAARADLQRADADLENSRLMFERARSMKAEKLISQQEYDQADAEMKMKAAAVESQKRRIAQQAAMLETNRDDLAKTIIESPMAGVVTSLIKEEGESVIGAQSFSPTVLMTVADLSVMEVEILVDETDIRNVSLGQEAEVRVDALEGMKIKGDVTEIGSSAIPRGTSAAAATGQATASTANVAKDFKVVVTLTDPPASLRSGLNATADIVTARKPGVLSVPIQAVVVRQLDKEGKVIESGTVQAAGDEPTGPVEKGEEKDGVFVVNAGQALFRPVETGIMGETDIEITGGLGEGDEIVVGSYKTLRTLKHEAKIKVEEKRERR
ncbi:MAG TPA: efflux RND transporter periplasmic adaptor subunit [Vicinamibacteria bacterium]|nr:efflux RND transporter periplasmic adaptor subunit [Vicinamibacteria bacterium]